jgi:hypothetical protein
VNKDLHGLLDIPPLSDSAFEQTLAVGASNNSFIVAGVLDDSYGQIDPFAGIGLTDEQYMIILQDLVNELEHQLGNSVCPRVLFALVYITRMTSLSYHEIHSTTISRFMSYSILD